MYRLVRFDPNKVGNTSQEDFSDDSADQLLDQICRANQDEDERGCLVGVSVSSSPDLENGRTVEIALAGEQWALICFVMEDGFPEEQWVSVGASVDEEVYACWDQPTPISRRLFVDRSKAKVAVIQWLKFGVRSAEIEWTDDIGCKART
jgi:hypothetical protein